MNQGTVTGGVVKEAVSAYTPPSFEAPSIRRVVLTIAISDSHKGHHYWNCEAEGDDKKLDHLVENAKPGRGIKVEFELAARPFIDRHNIKKGEVRFLRLLNWEFPERPARTPAPEPEPAGIES